MPAPSLFQLAHNMAIKNVNAITSVGDAPYDMVRDLLRKIENPAQLRRIELASPQIIGETGELWEVLIKRDILQYVAGMKIVPPKEAGGWYDLYKSLKKEDEEKRNKEAQALKDKVETINAAKAAKTVKLLDTNTAAALARRTNFRTGTMKKAPASARRNANGAKTAGMLHIEKTVRELAHRSAALRPAIAAARAQYAARQTGGTTTTGNVTKAGTTTTTMNATRKATTPIASAKTIKPAITDHVTKAGSITTRDMTKKTSVPISSATKVPAAPTTNVTKKTSSPVGSTVKTGPTTTAITKMSKPATTTNVTKAGTPTTANMTKKTTTTTMKKGVKRRRPHDEGDAFGNDNVRRNLSLFSARGGEPYLRG